MKIIIQNGISSVRALFPIPIRRVAAPRAPTFPHFSRPRFAHSDFINNYLFSTHASRRKFSTFAAIVNNPLQKLLATSYQHRDSHCTRETKTSIDESHCEAMRQTSGSNAAVPLALRRTSTLRVFTSTFFFSQYLLTSHAVCFAKRCKSDIVDCESLWKMRVFCVCVCKWRTAIFSIRVIREIEIFL